MTQLCGRGQVIYHEGVLFYVTSRAFYCVGVSFVCLVFFKLIYLIFLRCICPVLVGLFSCNILLLVAVADDGISCDGGGGCTNDGG